MNPDAFSRLMGAIPENLRRLGLVSLEPGIVVVLKNSNGDQNRLEAEVLDEIAAAITAIKIYVSTRNGKKVAKESYTRRALGHNNLNGNGKNTAWFKAWLSEISRGFDFNPYRRSELEF